MATSILLKFLALKWNISRTIGRIEVGDGSFFCIFHALSFEFNFFSTEVPFKLINRVKIAHSFLQSVSNQFHVIILSLPM